MGNSMRTTSRLLAHVVVQVALAAGLTSYAGAQQWVASWGSALQGPAPEEWTVSNATLRLITRSTIAGDRVRVRLENTFGDQPLTIGAAAVGLRNNGPTLVIGSSRVLHFAGAAAVTIPAGEYVVSDPVDLAVQAEQELAVSLYVPGADVRSSIHRNALTTSYLTESGGGDRTTDAAPDAFTETTTWMHWLSAVEVYSSTAQGAIVAFGDSITDGSCATRDGHDRWVDVLHARLAASGSRFGLVNAGIGGNTVIRVPPVGSPPGVERMDRDVLSLAGITHVILFLGTNDLRREATAEQVIAGLEEIVGRARTEGLKVIGTTIIARNPTPRGGLPPELGFGPERNARRHAINAWARGNAQLDGLLDFDAVTQDPEHPDLIYPPYDCDGIHPNVFGYAAMGRSIDLSLFAAGN